jgi:teichuronic acid exporter
VPQESLKKKTVKGLAWSTIDNFASLGITFVFSIILARLLTPQDYGTIALLAIFIAVSNVFINSGFSSALIRKPDITERDKSTAFYFNVVVGLVAYGILFLIAPLASAFYGMPLLTPLLRVTGVSVILTSLAIVQQAELSIKIDFKRQAVVSVITAVLSGCIGIYFALNGYGVWALAIQQVTKETLRTGLFWIIVRWHPTEKFSKESFRYLFGFGSKLLASGLLDTVWTNVYPIVIGKVFSPALLGLYSRAHQFAYFPSANLTSVLQRVTFPVLSQIQNEEERLRSNYRKLLRMSAFIIFPLMLGLSATADPFIRIVLGEKWAGCAIYLQIICFSMMWYPVHAINLNLLEVKGRSDLFLKLEIIKKIIGIAFLVATVPFGLVVMCLGQIVSSMICLFINTYYTGKLINVGYLMQMKDLVPAFLTSLVMWGIVLVLVNQLPNMWLQMGCGIAIGAITFIGISYLRHAPEIGEVLGMVKRK